MMAVVAVELLPERRCDRCTASQKDVWGCDAKPRLPVKFDGVEFDRCPRRPILDDPQFFGDLFSYYRAYQNGFLPDEGALSSQAHMLVEGLKLIDVAVSRCEESRQKTKPRTP